MCAELTLVDLVAEGGDGRKNGSMQRCGEVSSRLERVVGVDELRSGEEGADGVHPDLGEFPNEHGRARKRQAQQRYENGFGERNRFHVALQKLSPCVGVVDLPDASEVWRDRGARRWSHNTTSSRSRSSTSGVGGGRSRIATTWFRRG